MTLAVLIPAAGNSSRLGQTKQLIDLGGQPMLQDRIRLCVQTIPTNSKIFCVLGANAHQIRHKVIDHRCRFLFYPFWQKGLAHTIAYGISQLPKQMNAVLVILCDQWALTEEDLNNLVEAWQQNPDNIIACQYDNTIGVPAIFPKRFFSQLSCPDDHNNTGAKALLKQHASEVISLNISRAQYDLDTPEQLQSMQAQFNQHTASS